MSNNTAIPTAPSAAPHAAEPDPRAERPISQAARRALDEAAKRREAALKTAIAPPVEVGGRKGPDPTRFGDWEKDGIASDF